MIQKILRLFVHTLTVDEKHYLLNKDNLTQTIQIQLSRKQKTFSEFFFGFLKSTLNFQPLPKKMALVAYLFPEYRFPKTWLDEWLKSCVSEDP